MFLLFQNPAKDFLLKSPPGYIHLNPVRAGIVAKASDYVYSSASNYANDTGIITITKVDNPVIDVLKPQSISNIYNW